MVLNIIPQIPRENCEAFLGSKNGEQSVQPSDASRVAVRDFKVKLINQNAGGCKITWLQNIPAFRHVFPYSCI